MLAVPSPRMSIQKYYDRLSWIPVAFFQTRSASTPSRKGWPMHTLPRRVVKLIRSFVLAAVISLPAAAGGQVLQLPIPPGTIKTLPQVANDTPTHQGRSTRWDIDV